MVACTKIIKDFAMALMLDISESVAGMMIEGHFCFAAFPLCQLATQSTSTIRIEDFRRSWCPGGGFL